MHILREKNFRYFFSASLVSYLGSNLCNFGTSLFLLDISNSAMVMSLYLAYVSILRLILTPIMGTFADRLPKIKTIYICDTIFGITDLLLAVALFMGITSTPLFICIILNATINTIVTSMSQPASESVIPLIVEEEQLQPAYSVFSMMSQFTSVFGLIFAASFYAVLGYKWLLVINGISYIIAAIYDFFIKIDEKKTNDSKSDFMKELKEGFIYLRKRKELVALMKCAIITNFFLAGIGSVALPFMINTHFKLHPLVLASVDISLSFGCIIIGFYVAKQKDRKLAQTIWQGFACFMVAYLSVLVSFFAFDSKLITLPLYWGILIITFLCFGMALNWLQIPINTAYAKRVDQALLGRVMSIRGTVSSLASPIAMILFGVLVDKAGLFTTLLFGVIGMGIASLYAFINKDLKHFDTLI